MATKILFYSVSIDEPEEKLKTSKSILQLFQELSKETKVSFVDTDEYARDLFDFQNIDNNLCWSFRKFRTDEPIQVGKIGETAETIPLKDGKGKIETNHFVFFHEYNIIGYISNIHGNHYTRLERFLRQYFKRRISIDPVLKKGTVENLLKGKTIKKLDVRVPIKAGMEYDINNWSDQAISALADTGATTVSFKVQIKKNEKSFIKNGIECIRTLLSKDAKRLKATVEASDGDQKEIDFIKDKIEYTNNDINYSKDDLEPEKIYNAIIDGFSSVEDEIKYLQ